MIFEVYRGNVGLMQTAAAACVPERAQLLEMQRAGHSFKIDGKAASVQKIIEVVAELKKASQFKINKC